MLSRQRISTRTRSLHCGWGKLGLNSWSRAYHGAVAKFTTIDSNGKLTSQETGIMIGDPNESYVYVEPEVGNAIRCAVVRRLGSGTIGHAETLPLQFDHDSRHFAYHSLPFPRLDIPQSLPQSDCKISPATLWLSGNWHAITLDGTPDGSFERMSRESANKLRGALEKLKDS